MYVYKCAPAGEAAAPTVFMVWPLTCPLPICYLLLLYPTHVMAKRPRLSDINKTNLLRENTITGAGGEVAYLLLGTI